MPDPKQPKPPSAAVIKAHEKKLVKAHETAWSHLQVADARGRLRSVEKKQRLDNEDRADVRLAVEALDRIERRRTSVERGWKPSAADIHAVVSAARDEAQAKRDALVERAPELVLFVGDGRERARMQELGWPDCNRLTRIRWRNLDREMLGRRFRAGTLFSDVALEAELRQRFPLAFQESS